MAEIGNLWSGVIVFFLCDKHGAQFRIEGSSSPRTFVSPEILLK